MDSFYLTVLKDRFGLRNVQKMGPNSYKFVCPFHAGYNQTAVLNVSKHIFKCFSCGEGCKESAFFARMNFQDVGFIDYSSTLKEFEDVEILDYDAFFKQLDDINKLNGDKIFKEAEPLSMHPKILDYMESRLGVDWELPGILIKYHPGLNAVIAFDGFIYSQKFLKGRYINLGPIRIFTHLKKAKKLILVEGLFDYAVGCQLGLPIGANLGLAFTPEKLQQLSELGTETVYMAFDNEGPDSESAKAEKAVAQIIIESGREVYQCAKVEGVKDWGEARFEEIAFSFNNAYSIIDMYIKEAENNIESFLI